jgi:putative peptidoglycan binding protein
MRTFLVLICSMAIASVAISAQEKKKEQKPAPKKPAQATQAAKPKSGGPKAGGQHQQTNASQRGAEAAKGKRKPSYQTIAVTRESVSGGSQKAKEKKGTQSPSAAVGQSGAGRQAPGRTKQGKANIAQAKSKSIKPQHFNVSKQPKYREGPTCEVPTGQANSRKPKLAGPTICCFSQLQIRVARSELVAQPSQSHRVCVRRPGNPGYWYPAWGYSPHAYYAWDGPIYAYNNLPPDQVIANVQASLQQQGYYHGDVDGLIGPLTRGAIADYQRDHSLYVTSAIDEPTLQSLGMA